MTEQVTLINSTSNRKPIHQSKTASATLANPLRRSNRTNASHGTSDHAALSHQWFRTVPDCTLSAANLSELLITLAIIPVLIRMLTYWAAGGAVIIATHKVNDCLSLLLLCMDKKQAR
jgi:hypothetical protein